MGPIPVGDSDFVFVQRSCHVDQLTRHISLPSLKFTIFFHLSIQFCLNFHKMIYYEREMVLPVGYLKYD